MPSDYLRSLKTVFMHRPYRRMPETGWAVAYLFALSQGNAEDRAELASYCYEAGIEPERLRTEMMSQPSVSTLASPERLQYEIYPLTMAALRVFRASRHYRREILDKLALGTHGSGHDVARRTATHHRSRRGRSRTRASRRSSPTLRFRNAGRSADPVQTPS